MAYDQGSFEGTGPSASGGGLVHQSPGVTPAVPTTYGKRVPRVWGTATTTAAPMTVVDKGNSYAEVQIALAQGIVTSIDGVIYKAVTNDELFGPVAITGHQVVYGALTPDLIGTHPVTFTLGDPSTATTWTPYVGLGADWLVPYGHLALLRCDLFVCPQGVANFGTLKAIVRGRCSTTRNSVRETALGGHWDIWDANPADVIADLVPEASVDVGGNGLASSSYRTACQAHGLWIALSVEEDVQVVDLVAQILQATNAVGFWDGPVFRVVPLFTEGKAGNGATFVPVLTALAIDDDDIVSTGSNPVTVRRRRVSDCVTVVPVEWSRDTALRDAELVTAEDLETAQADLSGVRRGETVSLPCIRTEEHAILASRWLSQKSVYGRASYEFTVQPWAAGVIQVADLLSLIHAPMGLTGQLLRVTGIEQDATGASRIEAVEWCSASPITVVSLPREEDGI